MASAEKPLTTVGPENWVARIARSARCEPAVRSRGPLRIQWPLAGARHFHSGVRKPEAGRFTSLRTFEDHAMPRRNVYILLAGLSIALVCYQRSDGVHR